MLLHKTVPSNNADRKSDKTRAAILSAALEFFWHKPFRDLTVGELMRRVGASRPTFYQYLKI
jgi:TetR/AcrR family transcriptional regulator, ethionamide resistance regulator